jgi:hypothetical protein
VDADLLYQLACLHGLCITFATRDTGLAEAERSKVVERYAASAMKLLKGLHAAGHFRLPASAQDLKRNQCLDPLRRRKDFARLLADVERPAAGIGK